MIANRPIVLADDPHTVSRLKAFKDTCQRFLMTLEGCDPDNAEQVSYSDIHGSGPRFQRRFTTDCQMSYRTIDVHVDQGETGDQLEVAFYLSPRPGQPSYRVVETMFADGSNRPDPTCSPDDLKAIFRRYCQLADERLAGPITNPIRARDLPQHLTALIRSRLAEDDLAKLGTFDLAEDHVYGQLTAHYTQGFRRTSPLFSEDFSAYLQANIPLELGIMQMTIPVTYRHPDVGLPETEDFELYVTFGNDGSSWDPSYYAARLSVIDEMRILALWPDFDSDFVTLPNQAEA